MSAGTNSVLLQICLSIVLRTGAPSKLCQQVYFKTFAMQVHKHPAIRPQQSEAVRSGRRGRQRLHQRQLRPRLQLKTGVHCDPGLASLGNYSIDTYIFDPGAVALNSRRLLADVLGDKLTCHCHAHKVQAIVVVFVVVVVVVVAAVVAVVVVAISSIASRVTLL